MYEKQYFTSGQILKADHMNKLENGLMEALSKPSCFYVCQKDGGYYTMFDFEHLCAMGEACFGIYVDFDGQGIDILAPRWGGSASPSLGYSFESTVNQPHQDHLIFYPDGSIVFESGEGGIAGGE